MIARYTPAVFTMVAGCTMLILGAGCRSVDQPGPAQWDGRIERWGDMQQVLGAGQTEGRIALAEVSGTPGRYAVGALAGLAGEGTISDGRLWVTQVGADMQPLTMRDEPGDAQATLLSSMQVEDWRVISIAADVAPESFEQWIRGHAVQAGVDTTKPFPFVVQGRLVDVEAHVIRGSCPKQTTADAQTAPYRVQAEHSVGEIIGIYVENAAGTLTHHDSVIHAHVVLTGNPPLTAHLDRVGVTAGGLLKLPH